ncbi:hypothetical protein EDB86DRAFT_572990 [Lactarius hatsudake]|nr:hypothetical protein EDB86DRAFT_572990 [Lactarius hatsudake]
MRSPCTKTIHTIPFFSKDYAPSLIPLSPSSRFSHQTAPDAGLPSADEQFPARAQQICSTCVLCLPSFTTFCSFPDQPNAFKWHFTSRSYDSVPSAVIFTFQHYRTHALSWSVWLPDHLPPAPVSFHVRLPGVHIDLTCGVVDGPTKLHDMRGADACLCWAADGERDGCHERW